jgi:hypothetical protein
MMYSYNGDVWCEVFLQKNKLKVKRPTERMPAGLDAMSADARLTTRIHALPDIATRFMPYLEWHRVWLGLVDSTLAVHVEAFDLDHRDGTARKGDDRQEGVAQLADAHDLGPANAATFDELRLLDEGHVGLRGREEGVGEPGGLQAFRELLSLPTEERRVVGCDVHAHHHGANGSGIQLPTVDVVAPMRFAAHAAVITLLEFNHFLHALLLVPLLK